ncbi:dipeptide transporter ATP-binding subunit [compost metagenome]
MARKRELEAAASAMRAGGKPAFVPKRRLDAIPGQVSSLLSPPPGCAFAPRCSLKLPACEAAMPGLDVLNADSWPARQVRCIRAGESA